MSLVVAADPKLFHKACIAHPLGTRSPLEATLAARVSSSVWCEWCIKVGFLHLAHGTVINPAPLYIRGAEVSTRTDLYCSVCVSTLIFCAQLIMI